MNKKDPHKLTAKEAIELLEPHKEKRKLRVHTFLDGGFGLMGCDVDLSVIKKRLKTETTDIRLAGKNMRGFGHGLAYLTSGGDYMFLKTDEEKIKNIHIERGLEK